MTVKITDHALVRWLERAHGIDMEDFRRKLAVLAAPYAALKVAHVEIGGVWFVFNGEILVTVTPQKPPASQTRRHDGGTINGRGTGADKPTWQSMKRRRNHK
ncbi:hypothetical protein LB543_05135 [Mesorhizobium sp. ESP7-2]|uniref:hypothetical protein n=1 Tax=Mesorhizobium sp. ESP7-2 TaxID=2876622 RepID=UPI001CC9BE22|nr:hypothetical protein [Mesorhizobium sp. ESP7-2]MBZ9706103.1 hypothetical protein [Mesorhizobium sp. ESP7-2]